jgi:predicted MPP superfamily phosphohydrolase
MAEAGKKPAVRRVAVSIEGAHPDLNGFRIAQISDLHVNRWTDPALVGDLVDAVNRLDPHVVALTGDLADDRVERLREAVCPLSRLTAPLGRYFVTGNHEYRPAAGGVLSWITELERLGFTVLLNEHRLLRVKRARLALAGVPDYDAGLTTAAHASRPHAAARGSERADCRVLLAHQPRSLFDAADAGFDLQLSGHTHGGQCFPGHLVVALTQPFVSGLHRYRRLQLYVTSGVGTWGAPIRLGAPAEIALVTIFRSLPGVNLQ